MLTRAGLLPLFLKENRTAEENERIKAYYRRFTPEQFFEIAVNKKVLPFVANTLCALGLDVDFWNVPLKEFRNRNEKIIALLDRVYSVLANHGVKRMFVTENFGALLSADGDLALFCSGDVDNCADFSERDKIYAAFDELGFERKERFALNKQISAMFYPHDEEIGKDFYIGVDFHPLARVKLPCFVNADDFVDWELLYYYKDTSIQLPPINALAYICTLHISLHSFSRAPDARLYYDLINITKLDVDYNLLALWAKRDCTCKRLKTAAIISNQLFGTLFLFESLSNVAVDRILSIVYDQQAMDLIYEPSGLTVLRLELLCNDKGVLEGMKEILFPDDEWMRETYGKIGAWEYVKHIMRILR